MGQVISNMHQKNMTACNRKNRFISLLLIFLFCSLAPLFAYSGKMSGEKNLRVLKTQWFDIIYPERSEATAALFYEQADVIYEEVTAEYGLAPRFRMPLVIVPAVEQFNAFWSSVPYNHIVMYDTGFSGTSELAVFSETMLSVFRHELTHAVTYNMKNDFFFAVDKVLGDYFAPGMFSVTTGMAEGATVAYESSKGEGRLNDEYAKHYVKQAKIEGKFPSYHDVSGSADIAPSGLPYYFNGAFHKWLQDTYGLSAYADFWYQVVNLHHLTIQMCFKKAFGISLNKAWKLFKEAYEVPEVSADPVKAGSSEYLVEEKGRLYSSLSAGAEKLIWIEKYSGKVYAVEPGARPHCLFAMNNLTHVNISNDDRFIAASYFSGNSAFQTARVKLYDTKNGSMYSVEEKGLKEAAVIYADGSYYLVGQKYSNGRYSISVSKILLKESEVGVEHLFDLELKAEVLPFEFTTFGDGTFSFIKKDRLNFSIATYDFAGKLVSDFAFPAGRKISVRYLSGAGALQNGEVYFSYAEPGTMPRLGKLNLKKGIFYLGKTDLSGGIFAPVKYGDSVAYIANFFRESKLLVLNQKEDFEEFMAVKSAGADDKLADATALPVAAEQLPSDFSLPSISYNPFAYNFRGMLIPIGVYKSTDEMFPLGLTYVTGSPWTDSTAKACILSGGWNPLTNSFGLDLELREGTDSSLFRYTVDLNSEFDYTGWKKSGGQVTLSSIIGTGNISSLSFSNLSAVILSRQKTFVYTSLREAMALQFSTIRRNGPGRFNKAGFALLLNGSARYDFALSKPFYPLVWDVTIGTTLKICIPYITLTGKLLPASSDYGFSKFNTSPGRSVIDASAEATFFAMEIQKAVPIFTIFYLNDFYFTAGYSAAVTAGRATRSGFQNAHLPDYFAAIASGKGYYLDSIYIKTALEFTPNIGLLANSNYKMSLYATFGYSLHTVKVMPSGNRLWCSWGLNVNF